jgi:hypothetical protein
MTPRTLEKHRAAARARKASQRWRCEVGDKTYYVYAGSAAKAEMQLAKTLGPLDSFAPKIVHEPPSFDTSECNIEYGAAKKSVGARK